MSHARTVFPKAKDGKVIQGDMVYEHAVLFLQDALISREYNTDAIRIFRSLWVAIWVLIEENYSGEVN